MGNHTPSKHTGWLIDVESQVAVTETGTMQRILVLNVKGSADRLWVLGPEVEPTQAGPALRTSSDLHFDELKTALLARTAAVTWWRQGSRIVSMVVSSMLDPDDAQRPGVPVTIGMPPGHLGG